MAEESAPEAASGLHGKPARGEARPVGGRFATRNKLRAGTSPQCPAESIEEQGGPSLSNNQPIEATPAEGKAWR